MRGEGETELYIIEIVLYNETCESTICHKIFNITVNTIHKVKRKIFMFPFLTKETSFNYTCYEGNLSKEEFYSSL